MIKLRRIELHGFKSIKDMDIELRDLNVLIGANGAGKSNLISFFKMLNEMMAGRLQLYIGTSGRAQSLLHFGPKTTPQMEAKLEFQWGEGVGTYAMRLFHAAGDTLIFADETMNFDGIDSIVSGTLVLGGGHQESKIHEVKDWPVLPAATSAGILSAFLVYHFHDTSAAARPRQYSYIGDNQHLASDAGNLAAVLYRLRNENDGAAYQPIVRTIRLIAPFFDDFDLEPSGPDKREIILNWRQCGSDQLFGPHQLSDGTLRAICLITLLLMPQEDTPGLIIVDEPELGLHPYALNVIASLFKQAATRTQVLVSTQSSAFLDNFAPEDIIVAERDRKESRFRRLRELELEAWLEEYSLGEVWEKNVIGGGPH